MARKQIQKFSTKTVPAHGRGALNGGGTPGNRGGGRKPKTYKLWLDSLLTSQKHREQFKRVLEDADHEHFMAATKHAAAYAEGLPVQRVEDVTPPKPKPTGNELAERVMNLLPAVVMRLSPDQQQRALLLSAISDAEKFALATDAEVVP